MLSSSELSVVLPTKNEATGLAEHLQSIKQHCPDAEVIVVDDGSSDDSAVIAQKNGAKVVKHPYSMGNGAAIKTGARAASRRYVLFMDADGQHQPSDIPKLIEQLDQGFKMVIGARNPSSHASLARRLMNTIYNRIASIMTGHPISDLTSGFRLVEKSFFKQYLYLLPNGFSYPTTITMAFLRSGLPIKFVWIEAKKREGKSKIRPIHDGLRFLIIIMKIGALFSPMRLFFPISSATLVTGIGYYAYTYFTQGRFTNMSAVLFLSALIIFLIGIVSEQVSSLHYRASQDDQYSDDQ